jgi:hypothetical protein
MNSILHFTVSLPWAVLQLGCIATDYYYTQQFYGQFSGFILFLFFFLVEGFELRASCLLGGHSTT